MLRKIGGRAAPEAKLPSERAWGRSAVLQARVATRQPELVSDGASLAFPPTALLAPAGGLDADDPAVEALVELLWAQRLSEELDDWRTLARTEDEAVFGRGLPPGLITIAVRRDPRRGTWLAAATSVGEPLVATRDGIRASSWRLDPTQDLQGDEQTVRLLVTERTFASGQRADRRILEPDVYLGSEEIILRVYVTPRPGFQTGTRNRETPVRIVLAEPVGARQLIDGALAPHGLD